jgi:hypothetical protein
VEVEDDSILAPVGPRLPLQLPSAALARSLALGFGFGDVGRTDASE